MVSLLAKMIWEGLMMKEESIRRNKKSAHSSVAANRVFVYAIWAIVLSRRMMELANRIILLKRQTGAYVRMEIGFRHISLNIWNLHHK